MIHRILTHGILTVCNFFKIFHCLIILFAFIAGISQFIYLFREILYASVVIIFEIWIGSLIILPLIVGFSQHPLDFINILRVKGWQQRNCISYQFIIIALQEIYLSNIRRNNIFIHRVILNS